MSSSAPQINPHPLTAAPLSANPRAQPPPGSRSRRPQPLRCRTAAAAVSARRPSPVADSPPIANRRLAAHRPSARRPVHRESPVHTITMGLLNLMRQRDQQGRRRQAQVPIPRDRSVASPRKGSPCQLDSQGDDIEMYSRPSLPEDVWCHIHALMPMRDAARAACVSRAFLCSWRRHPDLIFNFYTLGVAKNACEENGTARDFFRIADQILKKHSGNCVKRFKIHFVGYTAEDSCHLNHWLQIAVRPGVEELTVSLPRNSRLFSFPYSLLCNGNGDSLQSLHLVGCSFSPTAELSWLRRLTKLHLCHVRIMEDEFGCLLSNSFALEWLEIRSCGRIFCLKVPCHLQQLSYLMVHSCDKLQMIDIKAPNLSYLQVNSCDKLQMIDIKAPNISTFHLEGSPREQLSLGEKLQMKEVYLHFSGAAHYARVELPSSVPNLETLCISSLGEVANTPMLHSKFLHLKNLSISLNAVPFSPDYDYFSLVSFLDACPSLEAIFLNVFQRNMQHVSIVTDDSNLRQIREHHHHKIKRVEILGFSSAKSLVELTLYVVESATSLKCLTLEASQCCTRLKCSSPLNNFGRCFKLSKSLIMEGHRAISAIRTYIEPKVPSTVKLDVVEPCRRCHGVVALDV